MKIKQIIIKKAKLIKLQLLKIKSYKKNYFFKVLKIEDIEYRLVKALKIIYKYNNLNKIISFFNNYLIIETKLRDLLKKTNHFYSSKYFPVRNISRHFLRLKNKIDLKIMFNKKITRTIAKKNHNIKIPIIFLHEDEFINSNFQFNYRVLGNFFYKKNKFFFIFTLLNCLLKKVNKLKIISS